MPRQSGEAWVNVTLRQFFALRKNGRYWSAGSSGRCNTSIESFGWSCKSQSLAWSLVELPSHFVELGLRVHGQVSPLRQILPQQTVGVLIGTTLLRADEAIE
jgi:hypothetical protein